MPTLFPPEYPERPDAPLLGFGPSFSEEISRTVIQTIAWYEHDDPRDHEIRIAAGLTMLEAFHPRDHLECMLAAQGVGFHCAIMETLRRAMLPSQPELVAIKLRANASQLSRTYSNLLKDMERRQSKPLPRRTGLTPPESGGPADNPSPDAPSPGDAAAPKPRGKRAPAKASPVATTESREAAGATERREPAGAQPAEPVSANLEDVTDPPEDMITRPDGTPGSLSGYIPKPPEVAFVPMEPAIMYALATRPKPWRQVNVPGGEAAADPPAPVDVPEVPQEPPEARGPLDMRERIFTGDSLSRFASARFDPDAPIEKLVFEDEDSVVELELVSTGGDPEAEAERQAMMAAHPEGKPIVIFRHGTKSPPKPPPDPEGDDNPPDT
jgi:hypothetical protein